MSNDLNNSNNLNNLICTQMRIAKEEENKRRTLLSINLPKRLTIQSPYPSSSTADESKEFKYKLDMRRKIEILKYNNQNTKTNNLTQKQIYSYLASNSSNFKSRQTFSQTMNDCPESTIQNSSTCCDIPGTPFTLKYEKDVPLYNYSINKNRSYK